MVTYSFHLYSRSSISFHSVFHSFHGLINSINWPASSVWVFIAQLGEHCSANAEATGSNPVEAPKIFFSGYFRNCLNCDSLRWSHTHSIYNYSGMLLELQTKHNSNCNLTRIFIFFFLALRYFVLVNALQFLQFLKTQVILTLNFTRKHAITCF